MPLDQWPGWLGSLSIVLALRRSRPQERTRSPSSPAGGGRRAAIAGLLVAALMAGCGGGETTVTETVTAGPSSAEQEAREASEVAGSVNASDVVRTFPPNIVLDGDIAAEKKGSPERALLEWWQAYQFRDSTTLLSLTSEAAVDATGEAELVELVNASGLQGIEILDVSESGNSAVVNVGLLTFTPENPGEPPPREPTNSVPETFAMVSEDGDWKFDQTDYLVTKVEALAN